MVYSLTACGNDADVRDIKEKITMLGGKIAKKVDSSQVFPSSTNRLIVGTLRATDKLQVAICRGIHILHVNYVIHSYSEGKWLSNVEEFDLGHGHFQQLRSAKKIDILPLTDRQKQSKSQFKNWRAAVILKDSLRRDLYAQLIKEGGGTIVPWTARHLADSKYDNLIASLTHVVSEPDLLLDEQELMKVYLENSCAEVPTFSQHYITRLLTRTDPVYIEQYSILHDEIIQNFVNPENVDAVLSKAVGIKRNIDLIKASRPNDKPSTRSSNFRSPPFANSSIHLGQSNHLTTASSSSSRQLESPDYEPLSPAPLSDNTNSSSLSSSPINQTSSHYVSHSTSVQPIQLHNEASVGGANTAVYSKPMMRTNDTVLSSKQRSTSKRPQLIKSMDSSDDDCKVIEILRSAKSPTSPQQEGVGRQPNHLPEASASAKKRRIGQGKCENPILESVKVQPTVTKHEWPKHSWWTDVNLHPKPISLTEPWEAMVDMWRNPDQPDMDRDTKWKNHRKEIEEAYFNYWK